MDDRRWQTGRPWPLLASTTEEVARRMHVSKLTVRRRIRSGEIPAVRIGGTVRIPLPGRSLDHLPLECTVRQVANSLEVSDVTVRRWIKAGDLPAVKRGRTWRVRRATLAALLWAPTGVEAVLSSAGAA